MKRFFALILALSVTASLAAVGPPARRSNNLSRQEIADGWLLLFDGESSFGWKTEGEVKVEKGELVIGGKKAASAALTTAWGNFELRADVRGEGSVRGTVPSGGGAARIGGNRGLESLTVQGLTSAAGQAGSFNASRESEGSERRVNFEWTGRETMVVAFQARPSETLRLKNIRLRPNLLLPLFNGKD